MPDRDEYPPGVPCWVDTSQPDADAAADFYGGLFGWEIEETMPVGSDRKYLIARIRGRDVAAIASPSEGASPVAVWNTYIEVASADEAATKVRDANGRVVIEPFDVMESGRMAVVEDPEGASFCVWQAKEHTGARVVNEHGSVNFNGLNTRDVEAAKAFYGSVFGWETLEFSPGAMWRLTGYGDFLEKSNPGLREGMAAMGAPPGFEDVVAALNLISIDQPDVPPHWDVTFGVDDADATVERAAELGGEIVVAPMDLPWIRTTVIRDPQGAAFIANQFVAENKDAGS